MVLFTGPLPISDTLKFPYMTHCCSDHKQVISWVGGQLPAGFDSSFLNPAQEVPYDVKSPVQPPKLMAERRVGVGGCLSAPRCRITASASWKKYRLPTGPHRSFLRFSWAHRTKALPEQSSKEQGRAEGNVKKEKQR